MNYTLGEINYINPPSHCWWLVLLVCDGTTGPDMRFSCSRDAFSLPWHQEDSKPDPNLLLCAFPHPQLDQSFPKERFFFLQQVN